MNNKRIIHFDSPEFERINSKKADNELLIQELNCNIQTEDSLRDMFKKITGTSLPLSTEISLPFHTDYGANWKIGHNSFVNKNSFFIDLGGITIGDGCLLGPNVTLISVNHVQDIEHRRDVELSEVVIQDNVWLGANVTVLPGVTIGQGSIVGANSLVTKDIPDNVVAAGTPARVIKIL